MFKSKYLHKSKVQNDEVYVFTCVYYAYFGKEPILCRVDIKILKKYIGWSIYFQVFILCCLEFRRRMRCSVIRRSFSFRLV